MNLRLLRIKSIKCIKLVLKSYFKAHGVFFPRLGVVHLFMVVFHLITVRDVNSDKAIFKFI